MRTLVLILLFIAVPLAGGSLKPEQEAEFWKGSGADLAFARTIINDLDCASSELYFNSCRLALLRGAKIQNLDQHPDFVQLATLKFNAHFPFERLLAQVLGGKTGVQVEWLVGQMINRQLKLFDPYAQLSPESFSEYQLNGDNKSYYGTGIEGSANGQGLFVFQIFPGSPAEAVGLRVHDHIVSINGQKIDSLAKAHFMVPKLNGTPGEKFVMEVQRDGLSLAPVTLQVAPVLIPENPSVEFEMKGLRVLQVRLRSFTRGTCKFLEKKVAKALSEGETPLTGLIIDLRHNRGGLVEESECLVRLFTKVEKVVSREPLRLSFPRALDFKPKHMPDNSKSPDEDPARFADLKLAVLIDAKSASASEIMAGALQDLNRAWIVGERSYGKGTTQLLHNLENFPKLSVTKTVSRYIRPSGLSVHGLGVIPNFEVPYREGATARERQAIREEDVQSTMKLAVRERWTESRTDVVSVRTCAEGNLSAGEPAVYAGLGHWDHQAAFALSTLICP